MSINTVDISTAAQRLGLTDRHVRRMCNAGEFAGAYKAGSRWVIPVTARPELADDSAGGEPCEMDLSTIAKPKRDEALHKVGLIQDAEKYCGLMVREGFLYSQALEDFANQRQIPLRTLQRWKSAYKNKGLAGLIDTRGGGGKPAMSDQAWNEFLKHYLDLRQPSVQQCYDRVCFMNQKYNMGWQLPHVRTVQLYIKERIPEPVLVLHREGLEAYEAKCAPYIMKDFDSIEPGAVWIGDHHQFNCWVRFRGKWVRPWLTAWMDMRSRVLVGFDINAGPNSTTIMLAFRDGVRKFGLPDSVKIDNGKDYDSQMWTGMTKATRRALKKGYVDEKLTAGLYGLLNVSVSFAIPYHPQSKAIERWFDTMDQQFCKSIPTYCGKDSARKPEGLDDYLKSQTAMQEAFDLETLSEMFEAWADAYNNKPHTGEGMEKRTPMEVFSLRSAKRAVREESLELLCQTWTGSIKVGKNGVRIRGMYYGQYEPKLQQYFGREVVAAYDPDDMSIVKVYDARSYRFITLARQSQLVAYGQAASEEDVRAGHAEKTRAKKIVKQFKPASRTAAMTATDLAIEAARQKVKPLTDPERVTAVKPVATVLDDQAVRIKREEVTQKIKMAAGAENLQQLPQLNFNLSAGRDHESVASTGLTFNFGSGRDRDDSEPDIEFNLNGLKIQQKELPELNLFKG